MGTFILEAWSLFMDGALAGRPIHASTAKSQVVHGRVECLDTRFNFAHALDEGSWMRKVVNEANQRRLLASAVERILGKKKSSGS